MHGQTNIEGGKVVSPMHRPALTTENIPGTLLLEADSTQSHSAAER